MQFQYENLLKIFLGSNRTYQI